MKKLVTYLDESLGMKNNDISENNVSTGYDIANTLFDIMNVIDPSQVKEYENSRKECVDCINNYIQNTLKNNPKSLIYFSTTPYSNFNDADVEKNIMNNTPNDCPFSFKFYKKVSTTYNWQIENEYEKGKYSGTYIMQSEAVDIKDSVFGGKPALYIDFKDVIFLIR